MKNLILLTITMLLAGTAFAQRVQGGTGQSIELKFQANGGEDCQQSCEKAEDQIWEELFEQAQDFDLTPLQGSKFVIAGETSNKEFRSIFGYFDLSGPLPRAVITTDRSLNTETAGWRLANFMQELAPIQIVKQGARNDLVLIRMLFYSRFYIRTKITFRSHGQYIIMKEESSTYFKDPKLANRPNISYSYSFAKIVSTIGNTPVQ